MKKGTDGVEEITFEYSRDRIKVKYTIRGDIEKVNTQDLSDDFKENNCVYPRACSNKDNYKGNRLQYETDCNRIAWALAYLNPSLHGKRGLIQRAVDSWRNCHKDPKLRSRRVRRMQKQKTRQHNKAGSSGVNTASLAMQSDPLSAHSLKTEHSPFDTAPPSTHHHYMHNDPASRGPMGEVSGMF